MASFGLLLGGPPVGEGGHVRTRPDRVRLGDREGVGAGAGLRDGLRPSVALVGDAVHLDIGHARHRSGEPTAGGCNTTGAIDQPRSAQCGDTRFPDPFDLYLVTFFDGETSKIVLLTNELDSRLLRFGFFRHSHE